MSIHWEFLATLERAPKVDSRVMAPALGQCRAEFLRRGWVTFSDYLSHIMVPFLDSDQEVEVEIDDDAGVFRYRSPQQRGRIVEKPLADITLHAFQVEVWLNELVTLIGIEPRKLSTRRARVAGHLWHLGDMRIIGTHDFAPVFVGRQLGQASVSDITVALCDPHWERGGIALRHHLDTAVLQREHVARWIGDIIQADESGLDVFDAKAFDRVLRGFMTPSGMPEPEQSLHKNLLKLPHFESARELSPERAKIIKVMWGIDGKVPPGMSWVEVNRQANTGYQSFDDAFGDDRKNIVEKISRGKYRVIRNP